jgi:ammonium transporter Rh
MVFVGFGLILTFTAGHSWSSIGYVFMTSSFAFQWAILSNGFWEKVGHHGNFTESIYVDIQHLIPADFAAGAVMVTISSLLGKLSPIQYLVIAFIEVPLFGLNEYIGVYQFGAVDMGGSMFIHIFGAYFGMAIGWVMFFKNKKHVPFKNPKNVTSYNSDIFAMIGTLFLWCFWPSFNGALAVGNAQHRVIVNTILALATSCCSAFATSLVFRKKFGMAEIQNATLAGGVAVGSSADLVIQPWGACLIGFIAGVISALGYIYLTDILEKKLGLHDTGGVNNLHGMPGIIGGLSGVFSSLIANEYHYGKHVGIIFPERAPSNETLAHELGLEPGSDRTAGEQAGFQCATLFVTIALSIIFGLLVGLLFRLDIWDAPKTKEMFDDEEWWDHEEINNARKSSDVELEI